MRELLQRLRRVLRVMPAVSVIGALIPAACAAAETEGTASVFWSNSGASVMSQAGLNGSGGGNLTVTGTIVNTPTGTAIDTVAGVIYWANSGTGTIAWARLNGPGGTLVTTGATVDQPRGLAIDPVDKRVYWANSAGGSGGNGSISWAASSSAGTTGGGDLVSGPEVRSPDGVAVDPASARLFWANSAGSGPGPGPGSIMSATATGADAAQLPILGATVDSPRGVAFDPLSDTLYWANSPSGGHAGTISYWNLGTATGGDLVTAAPVDEPQGLAIDPVAGRLYWANAGNGSIAFEQLDGSGGGTLNTSGATVSAPSFPALLVAPRGTGAPQVTGTTTIGSALTCERGSWAADIPSAFYFRAPRNISFQWSLNGSDIAGATSTLHTADGVGAYACREIGKNHAGSTIQTSAPLIVSSQPSATTGEAASAGASSAVLNGSVNPEFATTGYHFEYGSSTAYGAVAPATDAVIAADGTPHPVAVAVSGLAPNRTYHYRLVATNANGSAYGADSTFTTSATPLVSTGAATAVSTDGAVLSGTVNPENLSTDYYFEFGPTTGYGSRAPGAGVGAGADQSDHQAVQALTGLRSGTTYHFRLVAVNAVGTSYGNDMSFTTAAGPAVAVKPLIVVAGRIGTVGGVLHLGLGCSGSPGHRCRISVSTRVVERLGRDGRGIVGLRATSPGGHQRTVVVAARSFEVVAGTRREVSLPLNATGRMLRARFGRVPATVTLRSVQAGRSKLLRSARVVFGANPPKLRLSGSPTTSGTLLRFGLSCTGARAPRCATTAELTTYEQIGADGRTVTGVSSTPGAGGKLVTLAHGSYAVRAGAVRRHQLRLTRSGRALLQRFGRVPTSLTILLRYGGYAITADRTNVTFTVTTARH